MLVDLSRGDRLAPDLDAGVPIRGVNAHPPARVELVDRLARELVPAVVEERDRARLIRHPHHHGRCVRHLPESRLARPQLLLDALALGDVDPGRDDELDLAVIVEERRVRPGDQPPRAVAQDPVVLVLGREIAGPDPVERQADGVGLGGIDDGVRERAAEDLLGRVARELLAGPVEAHQPALAVEDDHEARGRVDQGRDEVALMTERLLGTLALGDVGRHGHEADISLPVGTGAAATTTSTSEPSFRRRKVSTPPILSPASRRALSSSAPPSRSTGINEISSPIASSAVQP